MKSKLLEAEDNYTFYCNNCKKHFAFIYTFFPTNNSAEYYICGNCNSVLPVKDIKKMHNNKIVSYFCCCWSIPAFC
jgi:hypothetical protein